MDAFRIAESSDFGDALCKLPKTGTLRHVSAGNIAPIGSIMAIWLKGKEVGWGCFVKSSSRDPLFMSYIVPQHRKNGYFRPLIDVCLQDLKEANFEGELKDYDYEDKRVYFAPKELAVYEVFSQQAEAFGFHAGYNTMVIPEIDEIELDI